MPWITAWTIVPLPRTNWLMKSSKSDPCTNKQKEQHAVQPAKDLPSKFWASLFILVHLHPLPFCLHHFGALDASWEFHVGTSVLLCQKKRAVKDNHAQWIETKKEIAQVCETASWHAKTVLPLCVQSVPGCFILHIYRQGQSTADQPGVHPQLS